VLIEAGIYAYHVAVRALPIYHIVFNMS